MRKELTKSEFLKANAARCRFQVFEVGASHASLRIPVTTPCYWFERNDVGQEHPSGRYVRDPYLGTVSLVVDGRVSAFFYLAGKRLDTCTFAYDLTPAHLAKAVVAMRRAKLTHLIAPAAEWALREMPAERRPVLEAALHDLLAGMRAKVPPSSARRRTKG
jgi:hypothetical protein